MMRSSLSIVDFPHRGHLLNFANSILRPWLHYSLVQNNMAAVQADGDLLVFLADDVDPSPGLIAAYAEYHTLNPDLNAVGIGPGLFPDSFRKDSFTRWLEDSGKIFGVPMRCILGVWLKTFFYAGNASIKKAKFQSLGGVDERFLNDAWNDFEFGVRWVASGGYSQFIAGATAAHRHAVSFDKRCKNMEQAGKAARVLEKLHPTLDHAWRTIIHRDNESIYPSSEVNAPTYTRRFLCAATRRRIPAWLSWCR